MELLAGEVWQVSKRNSQYFRSYLRKTTGGPFGPPPPAGRGLSIDIKDYLIIYMNINSLGTAVQHNFRRTQLPPSTEESISSLGTVVQHNFRHTLLVPSREENISNLDAAVQHNFRRTLLPAGVLAMTC